MVLESLGLVVKKGCGGGGGCGGDDGFCCIVVVFSLTFLFFVLRWVSWYFITFAVDCVLGAVLSC